MLSVPLTVFRRSRPLPVAVARSPPRFELLQPPKDDETTLSVLPPHVFCRVVDVKLHAKGTTDEFYAQVSLVPENEYSWLLIQVFMEASLFLVELLRTASSLGQPRRHLLTTRWSAFVNKKDAVLFLSGENGELRLGIRRAAQIKNSTSFPSLCTQQLNRNAFADVVHAISKKSVFTIYYNPSTVEELYVMYSGKLSNYHSL
ncbi:hypothetical protein V6N13_109840 [Hibiscus sabdariffa]|uniref:Uncharacterized protein n=1 Tax=Hibiscus sabdariffa TaxID=183260 RepID=A0ABR2FR34_9ROSI